MDLIDRLVSLVDNLDPSSLIPQLDTVLGWVELIAKICLLVPPFFILGFGLLYWFKPPKEANHIFGYHFYFGMGSVQAWRFTQWLAGFVWTCLGGLLLIIMFIVVMSIGGTPAPELVSTTITWLIVELVAVALSCLAINIVVGLRYDRKGDRRVFKSKKGK